jgi:hypothetical protein
MLTRLPEPEPDFAKLVLTDVMEDCARTFGDSFDRFASAPRNNNWLAALKAAIESLDEPGPDEDNVCRAITDDQCGGPHVVYTVHIHQRAWESATDERFEHVNIGKEIETAAWYVEKGRYLACLAAHRYNTNHVE